jgi:hypothetical protein
MAFSEERRLRRAMLRTVVLTPVLVWAPLGGGTWFLEAYFERNAQWALIAALSCFGAGLVGLGVLWWLWTRS